MFKTEFFIGVLSVMLLFVVNSTSVAGTINNVEINHDFQSAAGSTSPAATEVPSTAKRGASQSASLLTSDLEAGQNNFIIIIIVVVIFAGAVLLGAFTLLKKPRFNRPG